VTSHTDEIPEITPIELSERLERGEPIALVDVRELHEREIADLPERGQLRIPIGELLGRLSELDPEAPLVLYCRSGSRSGWATRHLVSRGFTRARNLKGGLLGWKAEVDPNIQAY
jgi:adenylyltransferase/sulfurtransferase